MPLALCAGGDRRIALPARRHYGRRSDRLLDLRWKLSRREDAEGTLRLFCDLRLRLEQRHYLAFFRIRRWLENNLLASVQSCQAAEPRLAPARLEHFCVEAIRRATLCAVLSQGIALLAPRLRFVFAPVEPAVKPALPHAASLLATA